jgi:hypothetical protein
MKNILITGGPVHAHLDDVKIITNKFKGGLMADLAHRLYWLTHGDENHLTDPDEKVKIIYLTSKGCVLPAYHDQDEEEPGPIKIVYHNGIDDYMRIVKDLSPAMDVVVLGAAVANLIPKEKIEGKFPSHNYKPGDTIPIDFTIAPRIIDEVKKVNPKVHLFGFKLLSGVDYYELVRAAYGVLLESKAVTVFANDANDLMKKYAITKERGVHSIHNNDVAQWIINRMEEDYYSTKTAKTDQITKEMEDTKEYLNQLLCSHKCNFFETDEGYMFGSGAVKMDDSGARFVTTARGKQEMADYAFVTRVDHKERKVYCATPKRASLNAPLFHWLFTNYYGIKQILHFHHQRSDLETLDYFTPGTDMDSKRAEANGPSFNIRGHGCILSYNKNGELMK